MNFLKFISVLTREINPPFFKEAREAVRVFTLAEKFVFGVLLAAFATSVLILAFRVSESFMVVRPSYGGELIEGVLGTPGFINPILASRDVDRDLAALMYSGLLKATPEGALVPDLAESYDISSDGLTYTFKIKSGAKFHDKTPVTADDVLFTIQKAVDPNTKSSRRASFEGLAVEKIDELTVRFTLRQPYSAFLENTTLGILPRHIWKSVEADQFPFSRFNLSPLGSGPYKLAKVNKNGNDIPTSYELAANKNYAGGGSFIEKIIFKFYPNEEELITAYEKGEIESLSAISPAEANRLQSQGARVETATLPRVFGVFWNQNHAPLFVNKEVRTALSVGLDKNQIIQKILGGYGVAIDSPIPPSAGISEESPANATGVLEENARIALATSTLEKAGWKLNPEGVYQKTVKKQTTALEFSISTSNAADLKAAAEIIKTEWGKIGAKVAVKVFESGDLNQNVIRPRKYDALLFGEIVGRDLDLFAFWHSSQRNDPGLNIALYANVKADKMLEEARVLLKGAGQEEKLKNFAAEVKNDIPAVFIYAPDFIYLVPEKIKGLSLGEMTVPAERFLGVTNWYIKTERIWSVFAN